MIPPEYAVPIVGVTLHARKRMVERCGRDLTTEEWLAAVLDIIDFNARLISTRFDRGVMTECYLVQVGDRQIKMVWVPEAAMVLTVLCPHHVHGRGWQLPPRIPG